MNPQDMKVNLDASKLPTLTCVECGNFTFEASFVIKKVSALVSPTGKETLAPIQVFTCNACGHILPVGGGDMDFLSDIKEKQMEEAKSKLIV